MSAQLSVTRTSVSWSMISLRLHLSVMLLLALGCASVLLLALDCTSLGADMPCSSLTDDTRHSCTECATVAPCDEGKMGREQLACRVLHKALAVDIAMMVIRMLDALAASPL